MHYAVRKQPQDLRALFFLSLHQYWPALRRLFFWVLLFFLVKNSHELVSFWLKNDFAMKVLGYTQWLLLLFVSSCGCRACHFYLLRQPPESLSSLLRHCVFATIKVLILLALTVGVVAFLSYLSTLALTFYAQVMATGQAAKVSSVSLLPFFVVLSFIVAFAVIRFIFVLPLLSIHQVSLYDALVRSAELTGRYWLRLALVYAVLLLLSLIFYQYSGVSAWVAEYHVRILFDLLGLFVILPLVFLLMLLLLDDLTERFEVAERAGQ